MAELNLRDLLQKLQHSGRPQENVPMWKKALCEVVNGMLADLNKMQDSSSSSPYELVLDFILHTVASCPQVFVPGGPVSASETPALSETITQEETLEDKQCFGLTCWVISHLLRMLTVPGCTEIWMKVEGVLPPLLQTVKTKEPYFFKRILREFTLSLAELAQIDEVFYGDLPPQEPQLTHFVGDLDSPEVASSSQYHLTPRPVVLKDSVTCQRLQTAITKVLTHVAPEMCQFARDLVCYIESAEPTLLWATVTCQLECGEMELKAASLVLLTKLLQEAGLPSPQILDYYISCLSALLDVLCSGSNQYPGDYVLLERSLLQNLQALMASTEVQTVTSGTCAEVHRSLYDVITGSLSSHGSLGLRGAALRLGLCVLLARLHCGLGDSLTATDRGRARLICLKLLQELGHVPDAQYVVELLTQVIVSEVTHAEVAKETYSMEVTSSSSGAEDKAAANADTAPGRPLECYSTTLRAAGCRWDDVTSLIQSYLDTSPAEVSLECLLEGQRRLLEVFAFFSRPLTDWPGGARWKTSKQPSPAPLGCLGDDKVQQLLTTWRSVLQWCCHGNTAQETVPVTYRSVVMSIASLIDINGHRPLAPGTLQTLVWILSIPWLPTEMTWMDLKPRDSREVARLASALADSINAATQGECAFLMCLFTKDVTLKWRTHVLRLASSSTEAVTRSGVVWGFPYFLLHSGPNTNHLVYEVLHGMLQDKSVVVQEAMAHILGPLACVISRKAILKDRQETDMTSQLSEPQSSGIQSLRSRASVLQCTSCDKVQDFNAKDRPRIVDPNMFLPFLDLLKAQDRTVRLALVRNFRRLYGHIVVRSKNAAAVSMLNNSLRLLRDPDYKVRLAFSKVIQHLVGEADSDGPGETDNILVSQLKAASKSAWQSGDSAMTETILLTVGQMARVADGELLLVLIIILLENICNPPCLLAAAVAHQQIHNISAGKGMKTRHLFLQFGRSICRILVDHIHDAQRKKRERDALQILREVADVFEFDDLRSFLLRTEHLLLPHLIKKATPTASSLIKVIAKQLGDPNHKGPLARNIRHIFCHLVCSCQQSELVRTFTYLEGESEWDLGALLRFGQNVDSELLLHLSTHHDQVLTGLKILASKSGLYQGPLEDMTMPLVADLLQPKLLGVLVHFDNYLNNGTVTMDEKKQAYASVISLIQLMGIRHITQVRVRVMTTLKIGLNFKERQFEELCCKAWNTFVHSIHLSAMGSMLSQVVVSLLPLLQVLPKQVAAIFSFLIVDNRELLNQHFHELYFLPDLPELADVNEVLRTCVADKYRKQGVRTEIEHLLKGASHESLDVRQLALTKLRHLLHNNQEALHKMVLGSESVDSLISDLVTTLLQGCRESDAHTRGLYGQCLGELGAIDPGRLQVLTNRPREQLTKFQATVQDDAFAFDLINGLAKAFLRAEDRNTQDCVAYAIQELIQIYEISSDSPKVKDKLWHCFEEEVREILTPLLHSKYMLTMGSDWTQLQRPVYRSKKGSSFESWVSTLTGYLSSQVCEEKAKKVFQSCRGVVKNDSQMALYLLPHVVVHVLLENDESACKELEEEILAVLKHVKEADTRHGSASDLRHMSAQTVFSVLAHLTTWTRHRRQIISHTAGRAKAAQGVEPEASYKNDRNYKCINGFLEKIPQVLLAYASFNCGAYSRSLMHYELFLKHQEADIQVQEHLDFLQKLYVELDEPDGVTGITTLKSTALTLGEQILAYESTGRLADASVCYDQIIQQEPSKLSNRQGLVRCRLALGELHSSLDLINGIISERPQWAGQLNAYRVEAAWKLGQWDKLSDFLAREELSRDWNVGLGKILLSAKNKDEDEFRKQLTAVRQELMGPLSAASMEVGSYHRGYNYIVRLHMLNEVEQGMRTLLGFGDVTSSESPTTPQGAPPAVDFETLMSRWDARLQCSQASYKVQEPILNLRRTMLCLAQADRGLNADREVGQCWLRTARIARECGLIQTAHSSLLSASAYNLPDFCLENAKWLWARGNRDSAQASLENAIKVNYSDLKRWQTGGDQSVSKEERLACAKVMLLLGQYCDETASWESQAIIRQYKEVQRVDSEWEDGYFYVGNYYHKLLVQLIEKDRPSKKGEYICHVVNYFGLSLLHGCQYIYQSMPCMLSLWLDYGAEVTTATRGRSEAQTQAMRHYVTQHNKSMSHLCEKLAPYQFLTALPQLISRICHAHPDVFAQLKEIIARLLVVFPQHSMWLMMAVSKSSYQVRMKRCQEIFARAKSLNPDFSKFLQDATKLTDRLLDLCNKTIPGTAATLSIAQHFKPLQRLIDDRHFSQILLPLQDLMTPTLPSANMSPSNHDAFPGDQVFISGIEDAVEVLPSLQKPKKITLRGSNGRPYIMLCKPKDDLRKDARLMEFNNIINKCLRKDAESRRRDLHIRTYTVTPLNEECGMLEWVPNTTGLRHILMRFYRERGSSMSNTELRAAQLPAAASKERKLHIYRTVLLPRHPPIFNEWFLKTFTDPTAWYNARLNYCRTTAVMSLVGYILGLGDRHGENILFDSTNGDCVHVDFNCLFNKGETFEYPEVVPFRLTHNMEHAMGPMGKEGIFRRACEVTLRVVRNEMDPLMSVLETFMYDPLVEWSKPAGGRSNPTESGEIRNEMAKEILANIGSRMKGVLRNKSRGFPLSVEGQVNHLIKEATNDENLCRMYVGWSSFM